MTIASSAQRPSFMPLLCAQQKEVIQSAVRMRRIARHGTPCGLRRQVRDGDFQIVAEIFSKIAAQAYSLIRSSGESGG